MLVASHRSLEQISPLQIGLVKPRFALRFDRAWIARRIRGMPNRYDRWGCRHGGGGINFRKFETIGLFEITVSVARMRPLASTLMQRVESGRLAILYAAPMGRADETCADGVNRNPSGLTLTEQSVRD